MRVFTAISEVMATPALLVGMVVLLGLILIPVAILKKLFIH